MLDEAAFDDALEQDPDAAMTMLVDMGKATDEKLRAAARRLAGKIVIDVGRRAVPRNTGVSRLRAVPADRGGELDLDASMPELLDARAEGRGPITENMVARHWGRPQLALCLVIDASGSMTGSRLAAAALTAAACAWRAPDDHAVLSFARSVDVLRSIRSERPTGPLVDAILALRGHGVTALGTALRAASDQLQMTRAQRRVVVLLSDCRATDDEDPVPFGIGIPELLILAPADDTDQAEDFARRTGARWAPMHGAAGAPAALAELLGP